MRIYIDFEGQHKYFCNPISIIKTNDTSLVNQHLQEIEGFIQQGYYAVGYLAYEAAMGLNQSNQTKINRHNNQDLPLLLFGIFDQYSSVESLPCQDYTPQSLELTSDTTINEYQQKINYIREQIELGNTYQTNYTIAFKAPFTQSPLDYYHFLQKNNFANYCAYLEFDDYHILSISPELFFKIENRLITTKPMKGTTKRGINQQQDAQQLSQLMSEKNLAENMMIVDLLRNDLSQISEPGSVTVPQLFTAEKYPTVWQLTSTIQGTLKENIRLYQIFQAIFPCGSITGAPKTSTMQIIANIENSPRGVYCGTIGYINPYMQQATFNIPIRTLTIHNQQMSYGVGGGITWDSTAEDEYDEILAKTAILTRKSSIPDAIIESLLLEEGQFFLLEEHLARLSDSANYFDVQCDTKSIKFQLVELANRYRKGNYKVRLLLKIEDGSYHLDIDKIDCGMLLNKITLAPNCVNSNNVYLYHKTTNRQHFVHITKGHEYINFNEKGEITEFVNGNIALFINQQWVTPVVSSGLLPGTMRQYYINNHHLVEQVITKAHLLKAQKIAFINSVRKWVEIDNEVFNQFKHNLT